MTIDDIDTANGEKIEKTPHEVSRRKRVAAVTCTIQEVSGALLSRR